MRLTANCATCVSSTGLSTALSVREVTAGASRTPDGEPRLPLAALPRGDISASCRARGRGGVYVVTCSRFAESVRDLPQSRGARLLEPRVGAGLLESVAGEFGGHGLRSFRPSSDADAESSARSCLSQTFGKLVLVFRASSQLRVLVTACCRWRIARWCTPPAFVYRTRSRCITRSWYTRSRFRSHRPRGGGGRAGAAGRTGTMCRGRIAR